MPPQTADLRQLPAAERRLLQLIFDRFTANSEWPLVGELQHSLDKAGEELDVADVGARINRALGHVDSVSYQGRAELTIHGIALCSGGEKVLADLVCLVRQEYEHWLSDGMTAELTSTELASACGIDSVRLRRTRALMDRLPGWQSISGGPDAQWSVQMSLDIRRFKDVETIDQLLVAVPIPGYPDSTWPFLSREEPPEEATARQSVFISCAELHKKTLAYPLRDLLAANGIQAFIVSDLPRRGAAWTTEEKITAYLKEAGAMIVLATPDLAGHHGESHPRSNIADEIARGRGLPHLRDRICVLKEHATQLPSNIDPAYESLDPEKPEAAFRPALAQLREWGFVISDPPRAAARPSITPEISEGLNMLEGLALEDPARTQLQVLRWLTARTRAEQAQLVTLMVTVATNAQRWEDRSVAGHVLESMAVIDGSLLPESLLDELSRHNDTSIRSSVAVILFDRAVRSPGLVPLDIVARLADSTTTDDLAASWYVYRPARRCLCQLALSRGEVWDVVRLMASSNSTEMRNGAASIVRDVAIQKPSVIPADLVSRLRRDSSDGVRRTTIRTRRLINGLSEGKRRRAYTPFSPF